MALFAHSFHFNGTSSETCQLRLVGFDNDSPLTTLYEKSVIKGDIHIHHPIPVRKGMKYSDVLKIQISVVKEDGSVITDSELRRIRRSSESVMTEPSSLTTEIWILRTSLYFIPFRTGIGWCIWISPLMTDFSYRVVRGESLSKPTSRSWQVSEDVPLK